MFYCRRWRGCWGSLMQDFIYSLFEAWEGLALLRYPPIFSMSATVLHLLIAFYFSSLSCSVSNRSWRGGQLGSTLVYPIFLIQQFSGLTTRNPLRFSAPIINDVNYIEGYFATGGTASHWRCQTGQFLFGCCGCRLGSDILYMFLMLFLYYFKVYLRLSGS